jgi:hypothetical protein
MTPKPGGLTSKQRILHVNIRFKRVVVRVAAATGLLVGCSVVGCSGTNETPKSPGTAGTPTTTMGGSSAGGSSSGGSSSGGANAGTGGAAKCEGNKIMQAGACVCPAFAPTFCTAITKCVSDMRDPDHCGGCDKVCGPMNACAVGVCTPDLTAVGEIAGCGSLALQVSPDKMKLYALSTMAGTLSSVALPAGGMVTPVATGLTGGTAFAVDATAAYVATGMTVTKVNLADGMKTVLVTETTPIFDVAVDMGKIYYAVGKDIKQADVTTPAPGVSVAMSADEGEAQGVAVSGGFVLYASNSAYNLEADPIAAGAGYVKIGASQAGLIFGHRSVQADATNVYWANGGLQRAAFGGTDHSGMTVASAIDGSAVIAFAIDAAKTTAYIATADGSFEKSDFAKGSDEAIWVARALPKVSSIVLDDTSAYLASACKILKSAR